MSPTRVFITTVVAALLTSTSFAKQKDEEASALIERARQASDIRRDGDAPFRLKATFRVIGDDGSKVEGTYTEFWNSSEQWRKEIVQGDFRRTIVGEGRKVW